MDLSYLQNESQMVPEPKREPPAKSDARPPEYALRKASGLVYESGIASHVGPGARESEPILSPNQYSLSTVEYAELREQPPDSESDSPMEHDYSPRVDSSARKSTGKSTSTRENGRDKIAEARSTASQG